MTGQQTNDFFGIYGVFSFSSTTQEGFAYHQCSGVDMEIKYAHKFLHTNQFSQSVRFSSSLLFVFGSLREYLF